MNVCVAGEAANHPGPARCHLTGTGLTHLGSVEGRDKMHKPAAGGQVTDSMRMSRNSYAYGFRITP